MPPFPEHPVLGNLYFYLFFKFGVYLFIGYVLSFISGTNFIFLSCRINLSIPVTVNPINKNEVEIQTQTIRRSFSDDNRRRKLRSAKNKHTSDEEINC